MIQVFKSYYLCASLAILALASCESCRKEKLGNGEQPSVATIEELDFTGLTKEQSNAFTKLLNDEICPCGCPKTFAQCLKNPQECEAGKY